VEPDAIKKVTKWGFEAHLDAQSAISSGKWNQVDAALTREGKKPLQAGTEDKKTRP